MIGRSVYPITPALVDWLNTNLLPIEESVFRYFQSMAEVTYLVDAAEASGNPSQRYAAMSALRDYNEDNGSNITYEEVLTRCSTYVFTDFGEWALYTDFPAGVLRGDLNDDFDAILARADGHYQILWLTDQNLAVAYRTPRIDKREVYDHEKRLAYGCGKGLEDSFVLPPDIESAVTFDMSKTADELSDDIHFYQYY